MMDPRDRYASMDELLDDLGGGRAFARAKARKSARFTIPGFRSGETTNMTVAVLGYLLIFALGLTLTVQAGHLWIERIFFLLCALSVVFLSCNYLNVWSILKIDRIRRPFVRVLAVLLLDGAAVLLITLLMSIVETSLRTP